MDHMPYRRVLITADVGRALLISSIPITAWLRVLSLTQLYVVAFLIGVLTVFFDVTYQSFLPSLVERDRLVSANSKLESGTALAGVIGPRLAGACRQLGVGSCGALLGGLLAEWSDLRTTMVVGTVGMLGSIHLARPISCTSRAIALRVSVVSHGRRKRWTISSCQIRPVPGRAEGVTCPLSTTTGS